MKAESSIEIYGDPTLVSAEIFKLAGEIQNWPDLLPHYRFMNMLDVTPTCKLAEFGASRNGFPLRWTARQELFPEEKRITFIHVAGITRGMWVEWRLAQKPDSVHVVIEHRLSYPLPVLGPLFAEYIVGRIFVQNIAGKTLRCFKEQIEAREGKSPA